MVEEKIPTVDGNGRVSDDPKLHVSTHEFGGDDAITPASIGQYGVAELDSQGGVAAEPKTHAASHGSAGSDAVTITESQISDLDHTDQDAIHDNVSGEIAAITEKTAPVDADLVVIEDSASSNAKKKVQVSNLAGKGHIQFRGTDAIYVAGGNTVSLGLDGNNRTYLRVEDPSGSSGGTSVLLFYAKLPADFKSFPTNAITVLHERVGTMTLTQISLYGEGSADSTINNSSLTPGTSFGEQSFTPGSSYSPNDEILIALRLQPGNTNDYDLAHIMIEYNRKVG